MEPLVGLAPDEYEFTKLALLLLRHKGRTICDL